METLPETETADHRGIPMLEDLRRMLPLRVGLLLFPYIAGLLGGAHVKHFDSNDDPGGGLESATVVSLLELLGVVLLPPFDDRRILVSKVGCADNRADDW